MSSIQGLPLYAKIIAVTAAMLVLGAADSTEQRLWRYRNLGKAFYENPGTLPQAVEEFKKALELAPDSVRERINYGLALLRAGHTKEGTAELEQAQKQDPSIPHTWFNLGIVYKRAGDYARAIAQFEQMIRLVPNEPISHYNLGVLHKLMKQPEVAQKYFEEASRLDPNLAAPHFQLYNSYRQAGRKEDAARELEAFQRIKKQQEGAAVPEDVEWCYYAEIYETIPARPADDSAPELKFDARTLTGRADPNSAGMSVLDSAGDGHADLLVWSAAGAALYRRGAERVADSGLNALKGVISVAPVDFNNDGLPDLCVLTESGPLLLENRKGRFVKKDIALPAGRFEKAVWIDYDHDYDLDLLLLGEKSVLLRNQGEAGFADRTPDLPLAAGRAIDAVVFRLVADTKGMDFVITYADHAAVLYRDQLAGKYEAEALDPIPAGAAPLLAADIDNNGEIDLAFRAGPLSLLLNHGGKFTEVPLGPAHARSLAAADLENRGVLDLVSGNAVFRNLGQGRTQPRPASLSDAAISLAADFDQDGRTDLAGIGSDGAIHVFRNDTELPNNWLAVRLTGVKNAKLAPGAEVEVKTGLLYQKKIYHGLPLHFGLRSEKTVDALRITWPNGLIQSETEPATGRIDTYPEAQRLSGSCPMIFTWNGRGFQFVTDVLGVAPLGASTGDGEYFPVDHNEYIEIPGEALAPRPDGRYDIRITEELREVSYLDQVSLIALDHPAGLEVFTNEKFKSPPFPSFRLFGAARRVYPSAARDGAGRDVLARLLHRDRAYPDGFRHDYDGVAELHSLTLDFAGAAPSNHAVLVLNGWVDWADGSTFRGTSQNGHGLIMPYLQVKDGAGKWRTVVEDMGIPAGKPKTIAVDLTGKFLTASREVRIVTNLCVYWDEIFLSEDSAPPPVKLSPLEPFAADLHFRGFSRAVIHPQRLQPESFDYAQVFATSMWNPTPGLYTRYGEVAPLLRSLDDRFVIMGSGDEATMRFDPRGLPPVPAGWRRDFLLKVDGWAKDGDLNTTFSQSVEPLPFHAMSRYPYSQREHFPDDAPHAAWREQYNTRPALRLIRPLTD